MRLRRLRIEQYGCFEHADLAFATEPGRINLIVAPNGAGKSVLRRAFHDLLFDIPLQSPMKFRHGYPGMALHAEALAADGTAFGFGWVRGRKPQRVTTDPARFAALQREVTPQQLEQLFALDTAGLRKGGTDLKGGTTLAGALLAGTGELAPAKAVRADVDARRHANWGKGKSLPPLNAAIAALDSARKSARAAVQRPQHRESQEADLHNQRALHAKAQQDRTDALAATRRLHRIALTRGHLAALNEAEAWLHAHPDAPALPQGLDAALADARGQVAIAGATRAAARQALDDAATEASRIERDEAAGRHMEQLARLPGMLGEAEKVAKDIVDRRAEHARALGLVRDALRDIGADVPEQAAGQHVPPVAVMAEARTAITRHAAVLTALGLAQARSKKAARDQAGAARDTTAPVALPNGLAALLHEVRADRNPAQHAAEAAGAMRTTAAALRAAIARAPGWTGTAEALRALTPPAETAFERLDAAHADAAARHRDAAATHARVAGQRHDTVQDLAALREQPLPDDAAIAHARGVRDRGMRLVLRRAFGDGPPGLAAEQAYAGAEPLALAYERQVRAADDLADRRCAELDRVNEADRLTRQVAALDTELSATDAAQSAAAATLAAARHAWTAICEPFGLGPDTAMADMRAILAARGVVIEAMLAAEVAADAFAHLQAAHAAWAARLGMLLDASGLDAPGQALPALLALGDDRIAAAQAADLAAAGQQARLDAEQRERVQAADALATAQAASDAWEAAWATLLTRLGRPANEHPDATTAVLERIGGLDRHDREARALAERIDAMQADLDRFAADVAALANAMNEPPLPDPASAARALVARTRRAAALDSGWDQAQVALANTRATVAEADDTLRQAHATLDAAVAATGACNPDDADARIAAAREHTRYAASRDAALIGLRDHGDGHPRAALQAEADAVPPDAIASGEHVAQATEAEASAQAEAAAIRLAQLQAEFDADAAATAAVATRADQEAAAAQFARRLEDQLVLNVASVMLARAMETVEDQAGGSALLRVSDAFAAVTGGAYGLSLATDGVEGEALYAVEHAFPNERKDLHDLSEGTRDQLYLALRLVALRDHCASAAPLPFIADDILQTFDDARATAALQALVALSTDIQVIVLTHHPHLAQIARALPAGCANVLDSGLAA